MKTQSVAKVIDTKIYTPFKSKSYVGKDIVYNISVEDDESQRTRKEVVRQGDKRSSRRQSNRKRVGIYE